MNTEGGVRQWCNRFINGRTNVQMINEVDDQSLNVSQIVCYLVIKLFQQFIDNLQRQEAFHTKNQFLGLLRPPTLTPLDFFLRGHLKSLVYSTPIDNIEELRARVLNGIGGDLMPAFLTEDATLSNSYKLLCQSENYPIL
ncbi:hypothetical protein J6590_042891 [Homalodisca vitripennis]|nr:hypothetical protein J6590_042891 [Homalodisca vitripennis]